MDEVVLYSQVREEELKRPLFFGVGVALFSALWLVVSPWMGPILDGFGVFGLLGISLGYQKYSRLKFRQAHPDQLRIAQDTLVYLPYGQRPKVFPLAAIVGVEYRSWGIELELGEEVVRLKHFNRRSFKELKACLLCSV